MLFRIKLTFDLVEVELSSKVVDLLSLAFQILDVLCCPLDNFVLSCGSSMITFVVGQYLLPDFWRLCVGMVHHFLEALL